MKIITCGSILFIATLVFFKFYLNHQDVDCADNLINAFYNYKKRGDVSFQQIKSFGNSFDVFYIKNSGRRSCLNPMFPKIKIVLANPHDGWIQVIRTDSKILELREFVDWTSATKIPKPFYTLESNFYDAPLWSYNFFSKPLYSWTAHTYAVKTDLSHKKIKCVGGIAWGFKFRRFGISPETILPTPLNQENWDKDWEIIKKYLD